ncbi:E3 ubiquitin-protein ligase SH3RF1-like [Penaeus monodon]|uniref:E3 ubiquitin-protein ligase SH3RF1-like n=1 Tax=Penaeus monodon TaxID=6687 RepID=UPI0018A776DA|nr:E3 ubiquitin-protein ligase SH3RF1-like [Penaeus monodon]
MEQWLLSDVLECSVCLEQLDSSSRVLPCQHTFCRRCLLDIVQNLKELRCPECRVLVEVPVDELPPNILLMRILESMRSATLKEPAKVSHTGPTHGQPPGRADPFDGPPLTQAPPPPSLQHYNSSSSTPFSGPFHTASEALPSSGGRLVGFTGGGTGAGESYGGNSVVSAGYGGLAGGNPGGLGLSSCPPLQGLSNSSTLGVSTSAASPATQSSSLPNVAHHRLPSTLQPCAKALYNYERKESRDLSFKKGDVIILRKKIDANWYQGELGGQIGFFPASYVQVITPLPSHIPQCKALYDFKMTNDEERDCLTFSKGDIITVLRRVDENWAEGKLNSRIGIFPLSFVDLNSAAKALMKLSLNAQQGPSRVAPPTPTSLEGEPPTPLILSEGNGSGPPSAQAPPVPHPESSSSSSSAVTSPDPSLPSPTSSPASPPNIGPSPSSSLVSSAVVPLLRGPNMRHQREKRHSFTGVRTHNPSPPRSPASPHRHSLEIVSPTDEPSSHGGTSGPTGLGAGGPGVAAGNAEEAQEVHGNGEQAGDSLGSPRVRSGTASSTQLGLSSSAPQVSVTTFYVALYSYRGRKADELELRKGYIYTVTEKCQDGWYKGRCITTDRAGVFPGNYVQVAKPQTIAAYLAKRNARGSSSHNRNNSTGGGTLGPSNGGSGSSTLPSGVVSYTRPRASPGGGADGRHAEGSRGVSGSSSPPSSLPPELPPRSVSSSIESSGHRSTGHTASWHAALPSSQGFSTSHRSVSGLSNAVSPPPNVALGESGTVAAGMLSPSKTDKRAGKERCSGSSGGISLMRKFTSSGKKKSKSPPPSYSMDNPVFEDSTVTTNMQHVHTRSESCPGTLVGGGAGGVLGSSLGFGPNSRLRSGGGSCRIRSRDRPNIILSNMMLRGRTGSNPDTSAVGVTPSSLPTPSPPTSVQTTGDIPSEAPRRAKQPAPLVRGRFRCIVPYPPNSEYELELQLGDIIYVHKKREDGWYKGTLQRTGKTGLFPASFVESC